MIINQIIKASANKCRGPINDSYMKSSDLSKIPVSRKNKDYTKSVLSVSIDTPAL